MTAGLPNMLCGNTHVKVPCYAVFLLPLRAGVYKHVAPYRRFRLETRDEEMVPSQTAGNRKTTPEIIYAILSPPAWYS